MINVITSLFNGELSSIELHEKEGRLFKPFELKEDSKQRQLIILFIGVIGSARREVIILTVNMIFSFF